MGHGGVAGVGGFAEPVHMPGKVKEGAPRFAEGVAQRGGVAQAVGGLLVVGVRFEQERVVARDDHRPRRAVRREPGRFGDFRAGDAPPRGDQVGAGGGGENQGRAAGQRHADGQGVAGHEAPQEAAEQVPPGRTEGVHIVVAGNGPHPEPARRQQVKEFRRAGVLLRQRGGGEVAAHNHAPHARGAQQVRRGFGKVNVHLAAAAQPQVGVAQKALAHQAQRVPGHLPKMQVGDVEQGVARQSFTGCAHGSISPGAGAPERSFAP